MQKLSGVAGVIVAERGRLLIVPLNLAAAPAGRAATAPARFGDGRARAASLWWIAVEPDAGAVGPESAASLSFGASVWLGTSVLGRVQKWSATGAPATGTSPASPGGWVAVLDSPAEVKSDAEEARTLTVAGERFLVRWVHDAALPSGGGRFFKDPMGAEQGRQSGWLRAALDQCARSPQLRWRARLAMGEPNPPSDSFADPVLEGFALQIERAWRYALERLSTEDAGLAGRLAARLCATVDFGDGAVMPAWPPEGACATLLRLLTDEAADPGRRTRGAAEWLQAQQYPVAWVVDDAGATDLLTKRPLATLAVANLSEQPMTAFVPRALGAGTPDITPVGPMTARAIVTSIARSAGDTGSDRPGRIVRQPLTGAAGAREGQPIVVHAGAAAMERWVLGIALPVIPPGGAAGPLVPDITMREWLDLGPDARPGAPLDPKSAAGLGGGWLGAGLLYRGEAGGAGPTEEAGAGWVFYLELGSGESSTPFAADQAGFARVWLGPFGAPTGTLRINFDGSVIQQAGAYPRPAPSVRVAQEGGHWCCWVPVPAGAVEADGSLRLAVERVDSRGVRSAWPRPMLPWQREPGRAVFDTRAWGGAIGSR